MTKDGAWRVGTFGWCDKAGECKHWKQPTCDKCFKKDLFELAEDTENDGTND